MSHNTFGHLFPRDHLGREPRAGDRLRRRRLPAAHRDQRGRDPDVPGQAPPRPVALHHAAARARHREDPVRRLRGGRATAQPPARRSRSRSRTTTPLQGLRRDQGQVPARPRRFHLPGEVRHPRLARLRPRLGARDREPRRRRRHRPQGRARRDRARRARPDGAAQDRPRQLGLGRGRPTTRSSRPMPRPPPFGPSTSTASASAARPSAR